MPLYAFADDSIESSNASSSATRHTEQSEVSQNTESTPSVRKVNLGKSIVRDVGEVEAYQSGETINSQMLESNPSGNGDITSILRILPNVQYDTQQLRSATPGEIDPAKISISGGLHYQNNFQLDGFNMNNDLNPVGSAGAYGGEGQGRSQGLAVDTSLLESITVQDSNVSAAYGGFTGGVVEANTRRPTKSFGANVSYQITQGNADPSKFSMTNYHIYEATSSSLQTFINSYSQSNQPEFYKHLFRSSIESKINEKSGVIASFTTTQSIIPLHSFAGGSSYLVPTPATPSNDEIQNAKQNINRQSYNFFVKGYYDPSDNVRLELSYTYAPDTSKNVFQGSVDDFYVLHSGGHNLGFKAVWQNALGVLTNNLGFSHMENSTTTHGYTNHKFWLISENHNQGNWNGYIREGGYAPYDGTQTGINNKIIQDFIPFEDTIGITHRFQAGLEFGYQYVESANPRDYHASSSTPYAMTQAEQAQCLATDQEWCDPSKAYATSIRTSQYWNSTTNSYSGNYGTTSDNVKSLDSEGYPGVIELTYGQYIRGTRFYKKGSVSVDNVIGAFFVEDSMEIPLSKFGTLNFRPGIRLDTDSYMGKLTAGHRLALNYEAPWNPHTPFASGITLGANRYYGRNLYAYAISGQLESLRRDISRDNVNTSFDEILAEGRECTSTSDDNCISTVGANTTKFSQLKVPYVDEYMIGFMQAIYDFNLGVKYIYRQGRDEIRRSSRTVSGLPEDSNYSSNYYVWTNEGTSRTDVVTVSLQNNQSLDLHMNFAFNAGREYRYNFSMKNYFLFAFDWTNVKRNYTDYSDTLTNNELANQWISWNGTPIRYADRPADNFNRPYTVRLNTTHTFALGRTRWLWNNFFRYRSGYQAMASIPASYGGNANRAQPDMIDGQYVDTFRPFKVPGAFTWDMRVGFEVNVYKRNIMYLNVDIYNVLDASNLAIASASYSTTAGTTATPVYEVGRQFWVQVGYKY